jgi:hypothetical protein
MTHSLSERKRWRNRKEEKFPGRKRRNMNTTKYNALSSVCRDTQMKRGGRNDHVRKKKVRAKTEEKKSESTVWYSTIPVGNAAYYHTTILVE